MKVLLTGGAGYIGSHAVNQLLSKKYEVIILDNLETGFKLLLNKKCKFYNADINDVQALEIVFKKEKNIEAIFHFAALISVPESVEKPIEYFQTNVGGTINLLKMATKYNIHNFIFSSTAAVYGDVDGIVKESNSKLPVNPYGESKLVAETILKRWKEMNIKNNYVIFRYFNVSGMGLGKLKPTNIKEVKISDGHLIPLINFYLLKINKSFAIFGQDYKTRDGSCLRDYIHVIDLANAHILGLEWILKNKKSDIFNLGTKNGFTVKEVVNEAKKVLNANFEVQISGRRVGDPAKLVADNTKALKILKWKPKFTLKDMIQSDYEFRRKM